MSGVEPMPPKTLTALRGSIAKWEGIVAGTRQNWGDRDCPLCKLFIKDSCAGCPVRDFTGHIACIGSPYSDYIAARDAAGALNAAQRELDFLRSLLPEGERGP